MPEMFPHCVPLVISVCERGYPPEGVLPPPEADALRTVAASATSATPRTVPLQMRFITTLLPY
jgi:hypothetical protein